MSRWFRFYDDTINDPKALKLSDRTFRIWVGLLCLASKNDGVLPSFEDMTIMLRMKPTQLQPELEKLIAAELLDHTDDGISPHNWGKRQYKTDVTDPTNADRQQRYRDRHRVTEKTVTPKRPETEADTESETEKKDSRAVAVATRPPDRFDEFWKTYPKREGSDPKAPARKKFVAFVKSGTDPGDIIAAARRYASEISAQKTERRFIAQAVTWLGQQRFDDYRPPPEASEFVPPEGAPTDAELREKYAKHRAIPAETEADRSERADTDHTRELPRTGNGLRQNGGAIGDTDHHGRHTGIRSLGSVLPRSPGLGAERLEASQRGPGEGDDGPDAVAGVV